MNLHPHFFHHARACRGHPRLCRFSASETWMAGTGPAMTPEIHDGYTP
jgi:hypothetical protein